MSVLVHAAFPHDVRRHFLALLSAEGISGDGELQRAHSNNEPHWACTQWFNVQKRKIPPAARVVVRSAEIAGRSLPPQVELALQRIEALSCAGGDFTPLLSERWRALNHHDHLLNDWGIHHLHLWPSGSRELLYVVVLNDTLLFVDLRDHKAFEDRELIEIVHRNWPKLIEPYRMNGILPGADPSPRELARARHGGVNALIALDGIVYFSMGRGQATTGMSIEAMTRADELLAQAWLWDEWLRKDPVLMANQIKAATGMELQELKFSLLFDGRKMAVIESQTGIRIESLTYCF